MEADFIQHTSSPTGTPPNSKSAPSCTPPTKTCSRSKRIVQIFISLSLPPTFDKVPNQIIGALGVNAAGIQDATIAGKNVWTPSQAFNLFQVDEETSKAEDDFKDSNELPPFEAVHDTTDGLPLSELVHHIVDPYVHEESSTILVKDVSTSGSKWKYTGKTPM
ncbi:hypothetical protein LOK49_LG10G02061 [Camellia lanceoleosa]|uniref:Uncharacterized protein n=1 Tax=Camellia lanceoleosa TaxID=1840588 RepID=A0ACC0GBT6_9ERIC|nr:hypothetical protein LOK49_LG10G02061 [Camellia lanceoleosa]